MKFLFFVTIFISSVSMTAFASNENCPLRMQNRVLLSDKAQPIAGSTSSSEATSNRNPVRTGK